MTRTLSGKCVLVTQADEFMGPLLCEVLESGDASAIVQAAGAIDVMVANLAYAAPTTLAVEAADNEWATTFAALVDPLPRLFRAVLPKMIERRSGEILVIGSASALRGMNGRPLTALRAARNSQQCNDFAGMQHLTHIDARPVGF